MRKLLAVAALLGAFARPGWSASTAGTGAAAFLKLPACAEDAALGEAAVGRGGGAMAALRNPAALAGNEAPAFAFGHALLMEDISYDTLGGAVPLGPGALGFGAQYLRYGALDLVDNTGSVRGGLSPRDSAFSLGWGMPVDPDIYVGAALKRVESRIYGSAAANALDLGAVVKGEDLSVGFSVQNMGPGLKFASEASPLPVNVRLGAAIPYKDNWLWLVDLNFPKDGPAWAAAGGQYEFGSKSSWKLQARAGYNTAAADTGGLNGMTAGFGLDGGRLSFDYALRTLGVLGVTHHIGVSWRWGAKEEEPAPPQQKRAAAAPEKPVQAARPAGTAPAKAPPPAKPAYPKPRSYK